MSGRVLAERTANALIEDGEGGVPDGLPYAGIINSAVRSSKKRHGGLWVGGTARLTPEHFSFTPNAMNRAAHSRGTLDFAVPLGTVDAVDVEWGFVTRIVVLRFGSGTAKVRCLRAAGLAEEIRSAVRAAGGRA